MTSQERYHVNTQLEALAAKHTGAGHADTTEFEWATSQHRDSLALYIADPSLTQFFATAENEALGRVRANCMHKMIQPCGPPPRREDD